MHVSAEQARRGKRILVRAVLVILAAAGLLFLPSPSGPLPVMIFDALLLVIFAMLATGMTGPCVSFVSVSAFVMTIVAPVAILTIVHEATAGSFALAFEQIIDVLTEDDPLAGVYLVAPALIASVISIWLARSNFRFPHLRFD